MSACNIWRSYVSLQHMGVPCQPAAHGGPVSVCTKCSLLALACHSTPRRNHPCFADQKRGFGEGEVPVRGGSWPVKVRARNLYPECPHTQPNPPGSKRLAVGGAWNKFNPSPGLQEAQQVLSSSLGVPLPLFPCEMKDQSRCPPRPCGSDILRLSLCRALLGQLANKAV